MVRVCPQCGSNLVFAGYEARHPVIIVFAGCNSCGLKRQNMVMTG